jgi:predicted metal-dependent peptidase
MTDKLEACALTPTQNKLWEETRVDLLWHCPAFTHILYNMLDTANQKTVALFTRDVPIAATDGSALMLNPDKFFEYNLKERTFIVAHEILHCILNHCVMMHGFRTRGKVAYPDGKEIPYIHELMNIAMDLVINDVLVQSKDNQGKAIFQYNKDWLHDPSKVTQADSSLDAYRKVYEEAKKNGKIKQLQLGKISGGQAAGQSGQGFDQHLNPGTSQGKDPHSASQERNEGQWQTAIAAAAAAAKAMGSLPAGLERLIKDILNPQVDWREHIKALFARKVGAGSFDWRKADRRLITRDIYAPARSGFGAGDIVVAVDTSGSIGEREVSMFFAEMGGILEDLKPQRLFVLWCDAKIHRVDETSETSDLYDLRAKGAPGGGGTSFVPVFDWMDESGLRPDAVVYLTDGYGTFPPEAPAYPVIWGSITPEGGVNYPWGDVVLVPKQAV